jgi:hypothetical protein
MYGLNLLKLDCLITTNLKAAKERGIDIHVESAGTAGYHVGEEPDERRVLSIPAASLVELTVSPTS